MPVLEGRLPETSIVGLDFTPPTGSAFDGLLAEARGDSRNPNTDLSCPLLIVYTSGTTGRPKGAVLRQEALLWNAVMSQHMHGLTSDDHVLTVLPFFHVGGLNIQMPARSRTLLKLSRTFGYWPVSTLSGLI